MTPARPSETQALISATWLAAALFGVGALPAFLVADDPGVAALAIGVGLGWACSVTATGARLLTEPGSPAHKAAQMLGPVVRVALGLAALFALSWLTALDMQPVVLVFGLTYPVFLLQSAVKLAEELAQDGVEGNARATASLTTIQRAQEARLA